MQRQQRSRENATRPRRSLGSADLSNTAGRSLQRLQQTQGNDAIQHAAHARLLRATPTGDVEQRITQLETEAKRSQNRDRALFHLNSFRDQVLRRATGWQRAAIRVGSAYAIAADTHRS